MAWLDIWPKHETVVESFDDNKFANREYMFTNIIYGGMTVLAMYYLVY